MARVRALHDFRTTLVALLLALAWWSTAQADDIEYVYDDTGGVVQAANLTSGQTVRYTYDSAGNITSQLTAALSALSIAYISPPSGPVGMQVVISGTGFSTTPASNTVSFNGTAATVLNAT